MDVLDWLYITIWSLIDRLIDTMQSYRRPPHCGRVAQGDAGGMQKET